MIKLSTNYLAKKQNTEGQGKVVNAKDSLDVAGEALPQELLILPVKNTVLFPGVVIPLTITRASSVELIKTAHRDDMLIGVVAQKNNLIEEPLARDLYHCGTVAKVVKILKLPNENTTVIIQGANRFFVERFSNKKPHIKAKIRPEATANKMDRRGEGSSSLLKTLKETALKVVTLNSNFPKEAQAALINIQEVTFLTHFLSSNLSLAVRDKQKILEANTIGDRGKLLLKYMLKEIQQLEIKNKIQQKVHTDMDKQQRDYILRQQIKALQDELGYEGPDREIEHLRKRGKTQNWPKAIADSFTREVDKLQRITPQAAEYPMLMSYLEFILELPWGKRTEDFFDLKRAKRILDNDHFGLTKVKNRILEYLAVIKLKRDVKGPILCLYGPPGVGKTSLGKSIAKSLKRRYVRMSLGGVHDEAEIRGHRRTYVGAMPGKVLQHMKKAKSCNPVFILDEIDKVRSHFTGDPASALLEVLDPEQNDAFEDNYLEVEYDLSKVLFIATANSLDTIHVALRDRMEIIEINGYTVEEKEQIAKRHLIPKQVEEHGLKEYNIKFTKEALLNIIQHYTKESGVREFERKIGAIMRYLAKQIVMEKHVPQEITPEHVTKALGMQIFDEESYLEDDLAGIATGLAWTSVGGEVLFVESSVSKGKGSLTLSGQLGEVMKESATTALSYLKFKAPDLAIDHRVFQQYDLHIHIPAGAIPKDGPSAGITLLMALSSLFTQRKVKPGLAMTGEITLRGKVLPVGGIKEKILAAKRYGSQEIMLSARNKRDIDEIEKKYKRGLKFHFVDTVDEVLEKALLTEKVTHPLHFDLTDIGTKSQYANLQ